MSPVPLPPELCSTTANPPSATAAYPFRLVAKVSKQDAETVVQDLRKLINGDRAEVVGRADPGFAKSATIFNGAIRTQALAVVKPTNAEHVSRTVKYCREHDLDVSVKGGGSGVHGQSVAGQVIIDLCSMNDVSVALPSPSATTLHESFARLRLEATEASPPSLLIPQPNFGKRRAEENGMLDVEMPVKRRGGQEGGSERSGSYNSERSANGNGVKDVDHIMISSSSSGASSRTSSAQEYRSASRSTPSTSVHDSDSAFNKSPLPSFAQSSSSHSSGSSSTAPDPASGRTTYINPSPTTANSFPFISTSFSSMPSSYQLSPSGYDSHPPSQFPGSFHNTLNTNPDPPAYAIATFGAGTNSKQLDRATSRSPYGAFHVPTSAFPVGAGQFMLGGFGFIGRKHGMAMDNVVEAEVVLADGRIVWVGENGSHAGEWRENENPEDLWWALRGAGPAMGIVTRFRAKAYYLPSVYAGNFIYIFDRATAPSLMRHVRDCVKGSPRTLYANMIMTAGPPGAPAIIVLQLCFSGQRSEGESYIQAISSWDGGRCMFQDFSERSFERQQLAVEEVLKGGYGKKWYIKSDMIKSMSDEVIEQTCERFQDIPDGCTWLFEFTGGGAQGEIKDSCYPHEHRQAAFTVAALHQWAHDEPPALDSRCVITAREWINEVIRPQSTGGPLPCFLQSSTEEDVRLVYGASYDRLLGVKAAFDPDSFFTHCMFPRSNRDAPDEWQQLPPLTKERVVAEQESRGKDKGKGRERDNSIPAPPLPNEPPSGQPESAGANSADWINGQDVIQQAEAAMSAGAATAGPALAGSNVEVEKTLPPSQMSGMVIEPIRGGDLNNTM